MLKILGYLGLALLLAFGILVAYAATRSDNFRIERSVRIAAAPDKIFPLINDLRGFNRWNPFERKDPAVQGQYSAATVGPGARYAWVSKEVGVGSMEIVEAQSPQRVLMKLDFVKPFEAHNRAEFALRADGTGTEVRWAMSGPSPLISKVMGVIFNMDKMIGADFEQGLANLKAVAEAP